MKVYRAVFEYNNADSCEWERWYAEKSSWYLNKEIAEKHIPTLEEFRDYLCDYYKNDSCFHYKDPYIEENDILDKFVPIDLKTLDDKSFTGFEYRDYNGPIELTNRELQVKFPLGRNNWSLTLYIDNECFNVYSNGSIYKEKTKNTNYYKYPSKIKEKFIKVCEDYYESIRSVGEAFTKKYNSLDDWSNYEMDDPRRAKGYELQRVCEVEFIIKFLSRDEKLKLSNSSILSLKEEINDWRSRSNPKYRDALIKLSNLIK